MITPSSNVARVLSVAAVLSTVTLLVAACSNQAKPDATQEQGAPERTELYEMLPDSIKDAGTIVIAGAFEDPPLLSADPANPTKPAGLAVDMAAEVGERLGITMTWQNLPWNGQLPALTSGRIDALIGQISDTVEREETVVDMVPFWRGTTGLAIQKGNPLDIAEDDYSSLCGVRVGVASGSSEVTTFGEASADNCEGKDPIEVVEYASYAPAMTALAAGGVDAVANGYSVLLGTIAANADQFEAVNLGAEFADSYNPQAPGINAFATNKDNPQLAEAIAAAMASMAEDGTYAEIVAEWDDNPDAAVAEDLLKVNPLSGTPAGKTK